MNRALIIPLVLLAAAIPVALIFLVPASSKVDFETPERALTVAGSAEDEVQEAQTAVVDGGEAESNRAQGGPSTWDRNGNPTESDFDPADLAWVRGSVVSTEICPEAEGDLAIYAFIDGLDIAALRRKLHNANDRLPYDVFSTRVTDANGAFEIPVPKAAEVVHLMALGRYQFTPRSTRVTIDGADATTTLRPTCGGSLSGQVYLPAGFDLENAELVGSEVELSVNVRDFTSELTRSEQIDQKARVQVDGSFEFTAVNIDVPLLVRMQPELLAAASATAAPLGPGGHESVAIGLTAGGRVTGFVVDEAGEPIAGASVQALERGTFFGFDSHQVRATDTAMDGTFELHAVRAGTILLGAQKDGFLESEETEYEIDEGGSHGDCKVVLPRGQSISGVLKWSDGEVASGVAVYVTFDMSSISGLGALNMRRGANGEAVTDDEGRFTVTGLGRGPFAVEARAFKSGKEAPAPREVGITPSILTAPELEETETGDVARTATEQDDPEEHCWTARREAVKPGTENLELVLEPPTGLAGRVVDASGAPVTSYEIYAKRFAEGLLGSLGQEEHRQHFENDDGTFLLTGLLRGNWRIFAVADGYGLPASIEVTLPDDEDLEPLLFELVPAGTISGVVRTPLGLPAPNAEVKLDRGATQLMGIMEGNPREIVAHTGFDGRYTLEGLTPGSIAVVADSADLAKSEGREVTIAPGEHVEGLDLFLREGGVLTGEVYDESGAPAKGAIIQTNNLRSFVSQVARSDEDGSFRLEHLEPGTWQVIAMPSSLDFNELGKNGTESGDVGAIMANMKLATADIVNGEVTHVVLGAPPANPIDVEGRVTMAGEPLTNTNITFLTDSSDFLGSMKMDSLNSQGEFSVTLSQPGSYLVTVQRMSSEMGQHTSAEMFVDIPEVPEHTLELTVPAGRISGQVRTPDGEPARETRITAMLNGAIPTGAVTGGHYHEGQTDEDGNFNILGLSEGTYTVAAGGSPFGGLLGDQASHGRTLNSSVEVGEDEWVKDVDFDLVEPGAIEVRVVDSDGEACADAGIFVRDEEGNLIDMFSFVQTTPAGKATYRGLVPGRYTILARTADQASSQSPYVTVKAGETTQAEIHVQAGTRLIVSITSADGESVRGKFRLVAPDGFEVHRMWSMPELTRLVSGRNYSMTERSFGPLAPGKYRVFATLPDGRVIKKPVSLRGQPERRLTLRVRD